MDFDMTGPLVQTCKPPHPSTFQMYKSPDFLVLSLCTVVVKFCMPSLTLCVSTWSFDVSR